MATLAFGKVGNCLIYVGGSRDPSDADWDTYIRFLRATSTPDRPQRSLVISDSVPNASQRAKLNEVVATAKAGVKVAVVTTSPLGRGVTTALNWFSKDSYRAFAPANLDAAMQYLEVPQSQQAELLRTVQALTKTVA